MQREYQSWWSIPSLVLLDVNDRALHRTKYGAVRVSAVLYEGRIFKVQACDGTVTAADGCVMVLYGSMAIVFI